MDKNFFNRIPGRVYLLIAILIFACANSVTRKLTELGAQNPHNGNNPISYCNVLFAGNICALIILILIYRKEWNFSIFKQLSRSDWIGLIAVAILSGTLAPALFFSALEVTTVNNVVLIGRIEPPLALGLSILILKEKVNFLVFTGAIVSFVGVMLTILLQTPENNTSMEMMGLKIGEGELMAGIGAIALAISAIISKIKLRQIPLGIFATFRMAIGTVIFFTVVLALFSPSHFTDIFAPVLWQWMLFYGAVIVVGGQLCWFQGLKTTRASEVSLANSFSPIAGILAAYFFLEEVPNLAQYIGGSVVLCGIALNQIGVRQKVQEVQMMPQVNTAKEVEMEVGFKGI
jgi:drug/metabolite transporter (DMT)-like permease